jgi:hypothetical protein
MPDLARLVDLKLRGGFRIAEIQLSEETLTDAIGREAVAQTTVSGRDLRLIIRSGLDAKELSVTLYHEVLEAVTVAVDKCPSQVAEFNEGDFERTAQETHSRLGPATGATLNRMLADLGF